MSEQLTNRERVERLERVLTAVCRRTPDCGNLLGMLRSPKPEPSAFQKWRASYTGKDGLPDSCKGCARGAWNAAIEAAADHMLPQSCEAGRLTRSILLALKEPAK